MRTKRVRRFRERCRKGEVLMKEGEEGSEFHILEEGKLEVFIQGQKVGSVEAGQEVEFVGEVAALTGQPRTATVVAATDCVSLCIPKLELDELVSRSPMLGVKLIRSLCRKLSSSAAAVSTMATKRASVLQSGSTETSLVNYMKGVLYLIEEARSSGREEAVDRLFEYFVRTNPWTILRGDGANLLEGELPEEGEGELPQTEESPESEH